MQQLEIDNRTYGIAVTQMNSNHEISSYNREENSVVKWNHKYQNKMQIRKVRILNTVLERVILVLRKKINMFCLRTYFTIYRIQKMNLLGREKKKNRKTK